MDSPGQMDVYIPIQTLNLKQIEVHTPLSIYPMKLPVAVLSYKTPIYNMPKLSIFTTILTIQAWDHVKFRLELSDEGCFLPLLDLQDTLIQTIMKHPEWSGTNKLTLEEVRSRFQPIISKNLLTHYLHSNTSNKLLIYSAGSKKPVAHDSFHVGQKIRVAIRFQGLLFLKNTQGNLFYRLQHQVSAVYL
jgi:hypothetical protein